MIKQAIFQEDAFTSGYSQLYLQGEMWVPSLQKEIAHGA